MTTQPSILMHPNPSDCPTPKIAETWQDGAYLGRETWCPGHPVTVQEAKRIIVKEAKS